MKHFFVLTFFTGLSFCLPAQKTLIPDVPEIIPSGVQVTTTKNSVTVEEKKSITWQIPDTWISKTIPAN